MSTPRPWFSTRPVAPRPYTSTPADLDASTSTSGDASAPGLVDVSTRARADGSPTDVRSVLLAHWPTVARNVGTLRVARAARRDPHAMPTALEQLAATLHRQAHKPPRHLFFDHPVAGGDDDQVGDADPSSASSVDDVTWARSAYAAVNNAIDDWRSFTADPGASLERSSEHLHNILGTLDAIIAEAQRRHLDVIVDEARKVRDMLAEPLEHTRDEGFVLVLTAMLALLVLFTTGGGQTLLGGYAAGVPHLAKGLGEGAGKLGAGLGGLAAGGGAALAKL